jgi:hypothetical protein
MFAIPLQIQPACTPQETPSHFRLAIATSRDTNTSIVGTQINTTPNPNLWGRHIFAIPLQFNPTSCTPKEKRSFVIPLASPYRLKDSRSRTELRAHPILVLRLKPPSCYFSPFRATSSFFAIASLCIGVLWCVCVCVCVSTQDSVVVCMIGRRRMVYHEALG